MPITHDDLFKVLKTSFPEAEIKLADLAGDNDHWSVEIKDQSFNGKPLIAQHRLVQNAVANLNIHALQIKTLS